MAYLCILHEAGHLHRTEGGVNNSISHLADKASYISGAGFAEHIATLEVPVKDAVEVHVLHSIANIQQALQHPEQSPADQRCPCQACTRATPE